MDAQKDKKKGYNLLPDNNFYTTKGQQSLCPITMGLATDPQQTNSIQFHIRTLNSWFVLVYAPLNDMTRHLNNRKVVAYV